LFFCSQSFALEGGPDRFGYRFEDSQLSSWKDISVSGTHLDLGKDQLSDPINIGFNFVFYGKTYSKVTVATNGFLTFSPETYRKGYTTGQELPTPDGYIENAIAGLWDYLHLNHT
jgi:hypothetical protein